MSSTDLTPEEIQACLKVLTTIHVYDEEHPDYVAVRRATGKMFKAVKRHRRVTKRDMLWNDALPKIEVDPETYQVKADGQLLECEPARELPLTQRYFLF